MITRYLFYFSAAMMLLASCKKESTPKATPDTIDPFARLDNAKSAADHQIFLFYQQTGFPILYNDTLTKVPLQKLNLSYHLTTVDSMVTAKYRLSESDILTGLDFVKNQVFPNLTPSLRPYSILLTDSVYTFTPDPSGVGLDKVPLTAYLGFNTVAISYVPTIKSMDATQTKKYRNDILKTILTAKINADPNLTAKFYAVSSAYYGMTAFGKIFSPYGLIPYAPKGTYGFLIDGTEQPTYYETHLPVDDLSTYLDTVLTVSAADFVAANQNYPLVMQKYNYLLDIFKTINFTVPK